MAGEGEYMKALHLKLRLNSSTTRWVIEDRNIFQFLAPKVRPIVTLLEVQALHLIVSIAYLSISDASSDKLVVHRPIR